MNNKYLMCMHSVHTCRCMCLWHHYIFANTWFHCIHVCNMYLLFMISYLLRYIVYYTWSECKYSINYVHYVNTKTGATHAVAASLVTCNAYLFGSVCAKTDGRHLQATSNSEVKLFRHLSRQPVFLTKFRKHSLASWSQNHVNSTLLQK